MGFECVYEMDTHHSVEDVYQLLRKNLPFVTRWRDYDGRFHRMLFTERDGLQIDVSEAIRSQVTEKYFGFRPAVTVSFELAPGGHPGFDDGEDNITRGVNWLQNNIEGDAVFLANGDTPVLLRRGGVT